MYKCEPLCKILVNPEQFWIINLDDDLLWAHFEVRSGEMKVSWIYCANQCQNQIFNGDIVWNPWIKTKPEVHQADSPLIVGKQNGPVITLHKKLNAIAHVVM